MKVFQISLSHVLAMGVCFSAFNFSPPILTAEEDSTPTITVTGNAEIKVVPDELVLTFSVRSEEAALNATVEDNDAKIKAVTEFLEQSKVEAKFIRTQVISITPIFEQPDQWKGGPGFQSYAPPRNAPSSVPLPTIPDEKKKRSIKPIGYKAVRQLSITISDLDSFEKIYRGLIEKGVNDVGGVEFRTTELRKYRDEARLKAVRAAREKADAMAKELGAKLASVRTIFEGEQNRWSGSSYAIQNSFTPSDAAALVGVAAGTIDVTAKVTVVFVLGETELAHE